MSPLSFTSHRRILAGVLAAAFVLGHSLRAADDEHALLTSVFAKTDRNYVREKGPDGRWVREYYAMVNGGPAEGTIRDNAQARVPFVAIATVLAQHLARQGYYPATDPDQVDFLLVVNWGKTAPFSDPTYRDGVDNVLRSMNTYSLKDQLATQARANAVGSAPTGSMNLTGSVEDMEAQAAQSSLQSALLMQDMMNRSRNQANARTARLLGYMDNINDADGPHRYAGGGDAYDDLIADIEEPRYYINLSAYDFDRTVRQQKPKLQWVTRMSMRAPGNSFAEKAAAMIAYSSTRFGQDTDGLQRKLYPEYRVNLEDIRFLGQASVPGWKTPEQEGN